MVMVMVMVMVLSQAELALAPARVAQVAGSRKAALRADRIGLAKTMANCSGCPTAKPLYTVAGSGSASTGRQRQKRRNRIEIRVDRLRDWLCADHGEPRPEPPFSACHAHRDCPVHAMKFNWAAAELERNDCGMSDRRRDVARPPVANRERGRRYRADIGADRGSNAQQMQALAIGRQADKGNIGQSQKSGRILASAQLHKRADGRGSPCPERGLIP
ncbi:hypothetical protein [Paracoccus cavernae]|uniref:hypothetical protein n=1 Tax=Paracoccus cavernae TaxID=1571207 RepID=UPI00360827B4